MADNSSVLFPDVYSATDAGVHNTHTLTGLRLSLSIPESGVLASSTGSNVFLVGNSESTASPPVSFAKYEARSRHLPLPRHPRRKIPKRKYWAPQRPVTAYIATDQANFRRMVQQVTGARLVPAERITVAVRPKPWRPGWEGNLLPTLDTSATMPCAGWEAEVARGSSMGPSTTSDTGLTSRLRSATLDGELLSWCFPTLESCSRGTT